MDLRIEAGFCKIRRDLEKDGHYLNRSKQALTSQKAKMIAKAVLALAAVAAAAYVAGRRSGYDSGFGEGFDGGFIVGDFAGRLSAGAASSWNRTL